MSPSPETSLDPVIDRVAARVPPLFPLPRFVAVNPFAGFTEMSLSSAAEQLRRGLDARVLPGPSSYKQALENGSLDRHALERAAGSQGRDPVSLRSLVEQGGSSPPRTELVCLTAMERIDRSTGTRWTDLTVRAVSSWCASYTSTGGELWDHLRFCAAADRTLELGGLTGAREMLSGLPADPRSAIRSALTATQPADPEAYLYRVLNRLPGWAGRWQASAYPGGGFHPDVVALLGILVAVDTAVARAAGSLELEPPSIARSAPDDGAALILLRAMEDSVRDRLVARAHRAVPDERRRPWAQAVFCIDVRSEPLRRELERLDPDLSTVGFAGFFGASLSVEGGASRCPVLIPSGLPVELESSPSWRSAVETLMAAPAGAHVAVDLGGAAAMLGMVKQAFGGPTHPPRPDSRATFAIGAETEQLADVAVAFLRNSSLGTELAPLVMICGHEGRSANNPHAAGLDCGACGGHSGALNARAICRILNDGSVRDRLELRGLRIPAGTVFVPAIHDTTRDVVELLDRTDSAPSLERLESLMKTALARVRRERAAGLGLAGTSDVELEAALERRASDWAEPRPEWGLARNALFIAGRRARWRSTDLEGRAFLHDYDAAQDADLSVLTLILTAPVVVASWINLAYFAATVDPAAFGSGTKALHNRVGAEGVMLGNGGDLRPGLALESVMRPDGGWYHEPLRLQVIVEAPRAAVAQVLAGQPHVTSLVANGWIRLFLMDTTGGVEEW